MNFLTLALTVGATGLLSAAPLVVQGTSASRPRRPWVIENDRLVVVSLPPAVRAAALPSVGGYDVPSVDKTFRGLAVDLNRDGTDDYILLGHPEECGTGGCSYMVVNGATAALIGRLSGNLIVVSAQSTNGFAHIETYSHGGAESGTFSFAAFDGKAYVEKSRTALEGDAMRAKLRIWRNYPRWPR